MRKVLRPNALPIIIANVVDDERFSLTIIEQGATAFTITILLGHPHYCTVSLVIAAHEGGPPRFAGKKKKGGATRYEGDRQHPAAEKFGDATTSPCSIVIAAHEGGPHRFSAKQHKWWGTRFDRAARQPAAENGDGTTTS